MRVWLEGADGDGVVRDPPCHVQPPHPSPGKSQVFLDILVWVEYHFIFLPCMHIYNIHIWFSYPKGFNSKWESTSYSNGFNISIIQGCCNGGSVGKHGQDNTGQLAPAQGRLQDCASRQLSLKRKKEKIITLKIYFLCKALGDDFKTLYM